VNVQADDIGRRFDELLRLFGHVFPKNDTAMPQEAVEALPDGR